MTVERSGLFVWVTWLTKLMAGDISCEWAPWFRTHFQNYDKMPSDFTDWNIRHTRLLTELRREKEQSSERILVEGQANFKWERPSTGLTLSGKPDLVAINGNEIEICDCKTGQPRASDGVQVRLYMYCLPRARREFQNKTIKGLLVYPDHRVEIEPGAVGKEFEDNLNFFLDILDTPIESPPKRTPNARECNFCDITAGDCPERIDEPVEPEPGEEPPI